jgi:hypothetical protein
VSGVPSGTGDALAQPIPDPPFGGSSLTHVSRMGGCDLLFTPQMPTRLRLLEHHPAFAPFLVAFAPQAERVTPDDRVDPRLSSRSYPPSVPGGDARPGHGTVVEDWDRSRNPQVSGDPRVSLPCGLLCPYQRTLLRGIMVSTPRGLRACHSPLLNRRGLSHLLPHRPTQPSTTWPTWRH